MATSKKGGLLKMEKTVKKILIVDDEEDVCCLLTQLLEHKGYKVYIANVCKDAVPIIKRENPEIMLLDRRLPDGDGIDLLEDIRKFNPELKVIMASAYDLDDADKKRIKALNVLEYLHKPITIGILNKALEKAALL